MNTNQNDFSIRTTVYQVIRDNIMSFQLKPGTIISTQEIAKKLNVSRTPVREAFIRLQQDGLVEIFPQRETIVSKINLDRLNQEFFLRQTLECAAMERAMHNVSQKNIEPLRENITSQASALKKTEFDMFMKLDNEFHELIFVLAEMPLVWETIQTMNSHYDRVRIMSLWNNSIMKNLLLEHQLILTAIEENSSALAKKYMKQHLSQLNKQLNGFIKLYPEYFEEKKHNPISMIDTVIIA